MRRDADPEADALGAIYAALVDDHGALGWWPGRTRWEVILGAILTQNTAWRNVEQALAQLRAGGGLSMAKIAAMEDARLESAIRASGYYRQKRRKIRAFLEFARACYGGRLDRMARSPTDRLRKDLLSIWGIGPETADSILLYAFRRPVFVVDAYTERVLDRHGLHPGGGYEAVRAFLERKIPRRPELYNDFHAQFVWVGHRFCRPLPRCEGCPLAHLL